MLSHFSNFPTERHHWKATKKNYQKTFHSMKKNCFICVENFLKNFAWVISFAINCDYDNFFLTRFPVVSPKKLTSPAIPRLWQLTGWREPEGQQQVLTVVLATRLLQLPAMAAVVAISSWPGRSCRQKSSNSSRISLLVSSTSCFYIVLHNPESYSWTQYYSRSG